VWGGMLAVP